MRGHSDMPGNEMVDELEWKYISFNFLLIEGAQHAALHFKAHYKRAIQ